MTSLTQNKAKGKFSIFQLRNDMSAIRNLFPATMAKEAFLLTKEFLPESAS